ncbi:OmpA family protein [Flexithrix dorotheae]|uniref:OmpA family protein n=1 Tax=Flexithrix dorotheae TaxID=70993 RepID=UPI000375BA0D|nr:OmpA family protein [Flexithrix dorotheae]
MKIIFTGLLSFFIWASGSSYFYVCKIKHMCPTEDCIDCEEDNLVAEEKMIPPATPKEEPKIVEEPTPIVEETPSEASAKTLEEVAYLESGHIQFALNYPEMINHEANKNFMRKLASFLKENPEYTAVLSGNTCDKGEVAANKKLGLQRANYVAKVLIRSGIPEGRIETLSEGESKPLVPNTDETAREKNRRVDIILK